MRKISMSIKKASKSYRMSFFEKVGVGLGVGRLENTVCIV